MRIKSVIAKHVLTACLLVNTTLIVAQTPVVSVTVQLQTSLGAINLLIDVERAPITAANFLRYVDQKRIDGTSFYRAMKITDDGEYGLVQGGLRGNPKRVFKPITHEPTSSTGLSHVSGAISMARAAPGTATADFFIMLGDVKGLDARLASEEGKDIGDPGYAVFGQVVTGMDIVRAILEQPRSPTEGQGIMKGQMLAMPVKILSARRVAAAPPALAEPPAIAASAAN